LSVYIGRDSEGKSAVANRRHLVFPGSEHSEILSINSIPTDKIVEEGCLVSMSFRLAAYVFAVFLSLTLSGCATGVVDVERERMLSLSFNEFDQTEGSGFRLLLDQKRHVEAAELIEDYVSRHHSNLTERERVSLHFHAGQLYGIVGNARKAVPHFERAIYESEPTPDGHPPYWNDYVVATSAFIRGDRRAVIEARTRMGAMNHGFHRLVDSFIENFEEPYAALISGQKMKKLPEEENHSRAGEK
jgi:hypothetical protein